MRPLSSVIKDQAFILNCDYISFSATKSTFSSTWIQQDELGWSLVLMAYGEPWRERRHMFQNRARPSFVTMALGDINESHNSNRQREVIQDTAGLTFMGMSLRPHTLILNNLMPCSWSRFDYCVDPHVFPCHGLFPSSPNESTAGARPRCQWETYPSLVIFKEILRSVT